MELEVLFFSSYTLILILVPWLNAFHGKQTATKEYIVFLVGYWLFKVLQLFLNGACIYHISLLKKSRVYRIGFLVFTCPMRMWNLIILLIFAKGSHPQQSLGPFLILFGMKISLHFPSMWHLWSGPQFINIQPSTPTPISHPDWAVGYFVFW